VSWTARAERELQALHESSRLRRVVAFDGLGPEGVVDGRRVISFASNDYLGLASHPKVRAAAHAAIDCFGAGAAASRLVVGTRSLHEELEAALARWKHAEQALVFSSGYAANLGVLATFGSEDATIFSDALNHASIVDGCRLARARTVIYPHADLEALAALLARSSGKKIVVTETVFSMDGDRVRIQELARLCSEFGALLVLDEAHDVFVEKPQAVDAEVLRVGTLSKALGALGGFVAGPRALIDVLVNRARTFVFTTGLSPADAAAARCALEICSSAEGCDLRARLRDVVDVVRRGHESAIVPIVCGADAAALHAARSLLDLGIHVPAIRPPSVPEGSARLRVTLSAAHTNAMALRLREALGALFPA
jgi:8-amino-7-oxononanoate synthase